MPKDYESKFEELATGGCIGSRDANAPLAYAYIRVSSDEQSISGRSGLPRQIQYIHEAAERAGVRVPSSLLFADDYTGFELERPSFSVLRKQIKGTGRVANYIIMEDLDRLARKAWMQALMLEEFDEHGVKVVFWREVGSRLEAYIRGAMGETNIRQTLQRMADGTRLKAASGRITSKTTAFGYRFVDSTGQVSPKVNRDTYYGIDPDEGPVVELIFQMMASGQSSRKVADWLNRTLPPPGKYKEWTTNFVCRLIKNDVYKGVFYAHRMQMVKKVKVLKNGTTVTVQRKQLRPPEEWIPVPVPPLVSEELWLAANRQLEINFSGSKRNARREYMLTGLLSCAECGYAIIGFTKVQKSHGRIYHYRRYACTSRTGNTKHAMSRVGCKMPSFSADKLDALIWAAFLNVVQHKERILASIDRALEGDGNKEIQVRIAFLEAELGRLSMREDRLKKLYLDGIIDEAEYALDRKNMNEQRITLTADLQDARSRVLTKAVADQQRNMILALAESAQGLQKDAPFSLRKRLLQISVSRVIVNTREQWFEMTGLLHGKWSYGQNEDGLWSIENLPASKEICKLTYSARVSFSGTVEDFLIM